MKNQKNPSLSFFDKIFTSSGAFDPEIHSDTFYSTPSSTIEKESKNNNEPRIETIEFSSIEDFFRKIGILIGEHEEAGKREQAAALENEKTSKAQEEYISAVYSALSTLEYLKSLNPDIFDEIALKFFENEK